MMIVVIMIRSLFIIILFPQISDYWNRNHSSFVSSNNRINEKMVSNGDNVPAFMTAKETANAKMCDWVLEKKKEIFPIKRGNGNKYLNYYAIEKYMKPAVEIENKVFEMANPIVEKIRKGEATSADLEAVYKEVEKIF